MTTLPDRLRAETRQQHEQMEAIFGLPASRVAHRQWTGTFLGFVAPLEEKIGGALGAEHPWIHGRKKAEWLRDDLRALGASEDEIAALPRCAELPALDSPARILGALYVFEGATLGGQFISRHLESKLGFSDGAGYRYFRSYGADVGKRWQEFRAHLQQQDTAEADDATVVAAGETFTKLRQWCEQPGPLPVGRASIPQSLPA